MSCIAFKGWACDNCTFINNERMSNCEMCSSPKGHGAQSKRIYDLKNQTKWITGIISNYKAGQFNLQVCRFYVWISHIKIKKI